MNSINKIFPALIIILYSLTSCDEHLQNAKTETIKIYGNCGMCEKKIETAALIKKVSNADWNKETKMAVITYDSTKTNLDDILKRITEAGYDSDKFRSDDETYNNLHGCCQYDRPKNNNK